MFSRYRSDLSSPAGVDGMEFGGNDCWVWRCIIGVRGVGFVGEQAGDEEGLEVGSVCIFCEVVEVEMAEDHCCIF